MCDKGVLEKWKQQYLLHSLTSDFKKNLKRGEEVVKDFLDLGLNQYCSISGGKDSTVMMHLVWSISPKNKFVSEKDDMDFPEELPYMEELRVKYNLDLDIITPPVKLWDIVMNHDITEDIHSSGTAWSDTYFYDLLRAYQEINKIKGVFLGLRAGESKGRLMNFKGKGHIYYNQTWKQVVCQPLALWTAKDVFAYLFTNDVPILPVYFKTKFVNSPEDIRKSWILPSHQASQGQAVWLQCYYPDIFNKLSITNPKLRNYV
jgi:3'-phosphoadenosine 5'-phosphosulfate sulfotransferase (PAPS reductase)/FAD synthetase